MTIKKIFSQLIAIFLGIAALIIFVTSFLTTIYYDMHVGEDFPHYKKENIILLSVLMIAVFAFFVWIGRTRFITGKKPVIFALLFVAAYCLTLILSIKPLPVNDSKLIDDVLLAFSNGNYSSLTDKGGYLFTWPFQLGYFLLGQIMDSVFGHGNYFAWDFLQVIVILITVYLLYKITWELFEDKRTCGIMAFMSMGMFFFYNYSTFIYGDILSMAPQTLALYLTILYVKREKIIYGILIGPVISLAVLIKTNCEIALIAISIILLFSAVKERRNDNGYSAYEFAGRLLTRVCLIAVMVLLVYFSQNAVNAHYCKLTGLDSIPQGSPSVSHIVMGLSESELENGWYNGYNYHVFAENGYDSELTKIAATEDLKERLHFFADNPKYFVRFMGRKFLTQWADSVCISTHNLDLVSRHVENPTKLKDFLVFDKGSIGIQWIMNVFMSVCYLCVLIYLLIRIIWHKLSTEELLLLVLLFGGMAFHQFWEGSSRYIMRYYVYWIPYAAFGMNRIVSFFSQKND